MKIRCPRFIKWIFRKLFSPAIKLYDYSKDKITRSIRMEVVFTFSVCLLAAFLIVNLYNDFYKGDHGRAVIDYSEGIDTMTRQCNNLKEGTKNKDISSKDSAIIESLIKAQEQNNSSNETIKIFVTDLDGKVLYKSKNAEEVQLNINDLVQKVSAFRKIYNRNIESNYYMRNGDNRRVVLDKVTEYVELDGIDFKDSKAYVIVKGIPHGNTTYLKQDNSFFSLILGISVFIALFYFITNKKMKYIESILEGLFQIARGDLDFRLEESGKDELGKLAGNINFMAGELKTRIEGERIAEKTKSDLITNVSHDLRTPLTSIKGYLGLVREKRYKDESEMQEYLNIAYNKSEKLEILINDLFEYTKLSNKGITLNKTEISFNGLLEQLIEELYLICEENNVVITKNIPDEKISAFVDGDKLVRVFENLLMNAIRYSPKPGQINVSLKKDDTYVIVGIKNKCENVNKEDLNKIFDRFYRLDKSRSQSTGGSGLGLAISKSIVELHGGKIWAELLEDSIEFSVKFYINEKNS